MPQTPITTTMKHDYGTLQRHSDGGQVTSRKNWWKIEDWSASHGGSSLGQARKFLAERNFAFSKEGLHSEQTEYLCTRAQRGMISYHKCSLTELRKFCKDRDLHVSKRFNHSKADIQKELSKDELRDLLEYSDEQVKFPRFMELPAELRVMVYKSSFNMMHGAKNENWQSKALDLEPPPIASVSKLLRRESLPLLYEHATLTIDMMKENNYREPHNTTEFFGVAPLAVVEAVKDILIVVSRGQMDTKNVHTWNLKFLGSSKSPYRLSLARKKVHGSGKRSRLVPEEGCRRLDKALGKVMDAMKPQEVGKAAKLRRGDIYLIRKAVQSTLNE